MNKKIQELTELTGSLGNKLIIMELSKKIVKFSYIILCISAITTMIICFIYKVSNIYALAFWLLFIAFILFFVEKFLINIEPNLKNNIKFLKEYTNILETEHDKSKSNKSK